MQEGAGWKRKASGEKGWDKEPGGIGFPGVDSKMVSDWAVKSFTDSRILAASQSNNLKDTLSTKKQKNDTGADFQISICVLALVTMRRGDCYQPMVSNPTLASLNPQR